MMSTNDAVDKKQKKPLTPLEKVERANERIAKAKDVIARNSETMRKYETRQKIVLGAMLMKLATEDWRFGKAMGQLVDKLKDEDKAMFGGFVYAEAPKEANVPVTVPKRTVTVKAPDDVTKASDMASDVAVQIELPAD